LVCALPEQPKSIKCQKTDKHGSLLHGVRTKIKRQREQLVETIGGGITNNLDVNRQGSDGEKAPTEANA